MNIVKNARSQLLTLEYLLSDCLSRADKQAAEKILERPFVGVSIDSRTVGQGEIFFAVKGKNLDGHAFVQGALSAGAVVVIVQEGYREVRDARILYVRDPLLCLHAVAKKIRDHYNPLVIAVTGSVGKTTTKNYIGGVLSEIAPTVASYKSYNNEFGIPLTLCNINQKTKFASIEIGINTPGEMDFLADTVAPDIAVITNIGMAHIGNFGSVDTILKEKSKLLEKLRPGGTAILNADDEYLRSLEAELQDRCVRQIWFGTNESSQVRVASREIVGVNQKLQVSTPRISAEIVISPSDAGSMYACLASLAVGIAANIEEATVQQALFSASIESRLKIRPIPQGRVIDDTYNASVASVLNGINLLKETGENAIFVLGDLREVGAYLVGSYKEILSAVKKISGEIIAVGETPDEWNEAARLSQFDSDKLTLVEEWNEAVEILSDMRMPPNTAVFIKGSRFSHLERVALSLENRRSSCDKVVCREYIHCSACPKFGA